MSYGPNRLGVALDWLTDLLTPRPVLQLGLVDAAHAGMTAAEHRPAR